MQDSFILKDYGFEFDKVNEFNYWYNKSIEYKNLNELAKAI